MSKNITPLEEIYDAFLSLITDDMYLELSSEETYTDIKNIFLSSISNFQFPRFDIYDYEFVEETIEPPEQNSEGLFNSLSIVSQDGEVPAEDNEEKTIVRGYYNTKLTREEINIISRLMLVEWVRRQLASVDVTRQAYSSRDFEFTSQANHLDKLNGLMTTFSKEATRMQRLYTRRVQGTNGIYTPNYLGFGGKNSGN